MISVCINSRNREHDIVKTLRSILKSSYKDFEIVLVDQSDNPYNLSEFKRHSNLRHITDKGRGAGRAKCIAVENAMGDLLAFTDDDCIVDKDWLGIIHKIFLKEKGISGVFGRVLPYSPQKNSGKVSTCINDKDKRMIVSVPCEHWKYLGYGNNMAFRKKAITNVGLFRKWLGPGSIGNNADDAEIALRLLTKGHKLIYDPRPLTYHNKWLRKKDVDKQMLSYNFGEVVVYGYYLFHGIKVGSDVVRESFKETMYQIRQAVKGLILLRGLNESLGKLKWNTYLLIQKTKALLIAYYFSKVDPLTHYS